MTAKRSKPIAAVILDAGGVILHPNFDWIIEQAKSHDIDLRLEDLHLAYYRVMYLVDSDPSMQRGGMAVSTDEIRLFLMSRLLDAAGVKPEAIDRAAPAMAREAGQTFPRESDIYHYAMPQTKAQLEQLKDAGFLLGVASNNDGALEAQLLGAGVDHLFGVALDSGIEGVAKPEPELLLRAARALAVAPESCLFVGDIDRVDGAAARAAKMHFALIDPLAQDRPTQPLAIASLAEIFDHFRPAADKS